MTIGYINTKHSAQSTPAISRSTTTVSVHLLNTTPWCSRSSFHSVRCTAVLDYSKFSSCTRVHHRSLSWLPSTDKLHLHFVSSIKTGSVKAQSQCLLTPHSLKWMNQKVCQQAAAGFKHSPQHTRDISLFFVRIPQWQLDWSKTRQKTWWCNYNCVDILHGYNSSPLSTA